MSEKESNSQMNRRDFLHSTAAVGAGLMITPVVFGQGGKADDLNIALLGAGAEGQILVEICRKLPGIRVKAVCDIWEKYNLKRTSRMLKRYKHENNAYIDYRDMLAKEKDLDAVIIATPDFVHAEHANACLEAGLHVYCEKEMSNDLAKAKSMVQTARKTGKLLQIGHQRRSNPRYINCKEEIIDKAKLLGRITHINAQWNRGVASCQDLTCPKRYIIDDATLKKYGYDSIHQFRNWRWFKNLGGGPVVDLGSHQIDIFSWFLDAQPKSVMASGGLDYYKNREWYDNVLAIYEFETKDGPVRAFYETLTTSGNRSYGEEFMGVDATLAISEKASVGHLLKEPSAPDWEKWVKAGLIKEAVIKQLKKTKKKRGVADARESAPLPKWNMTVDLNKPAHQPHLENFFTAVRANDKSMLNCPAEIGYETAVAVLKANDAVAAGKRLDFKEDEFKV